MDELFVGFAIGKQKPLVVELKSTKEIRINAEGDRALLFRKLEGLKAS